MNTLSQGGQQPLVSIGIIARNEQEIIGQTLSTLFQQTLFQKAKDLGFRVEVIVVLNNSKDNSERLVREKIAIENQAHTARGVFTSRLVHLKQAGKINAWNTYVHRLSSPSAKFLILVDGDILLNEKSTLWKLVDHLRCDPQAWAATDMPLRDSELSRLTKNPIKPVNGLLCGQLYCIWSDIARRIYLPKDLPACEDGYIKALLCSDFLASDRLNLNRIITVPGTWHLFEGYTSLRSILRQHKRQVIGQTVVHLLIDDIFPGLKPDQKQNLASTIMGWERERPDWLKTRIRQHLKEVRAFWKLHPHLIRHHWKQFSLTAKMSAKSLCRSMAKTALDLTAAWLAHKHFKAEQYAYWPETRSPKLGRLATTTPLQ